MSEWRIASRVFRFGALGTLFLAAVAARGQTPPAPASPASTPGSREAMLSSIKISGT